MIFASMLHARCEFKSKNLSISHKMRIFNTYISTAFLYNAETWTLTDALANIIDSFHRRLLRITVNIRYPKLISNKKVYNLTKQTPWTKIIKKRRLCLFGHILRLHHQTPAQKALRRSLEPIKRRRGTPNKTWIDLIIEDLKPTLQHNNIKPIWTHETYNELMKIASDRAEWEQEVWRSMGRKP